METDAARVAPMETKTAVVFAGDYLNKLTGEKVERVVLPDFGGHNFVPAAITGKKAPTPVRKFRSFGGRRGR